jgi:hypothetical protein
MLSCQNVGGVLKWIPMAGPKIWYDKWTVVNGTWVPAPACPAGGTPLIQVTGQTLYVDPTATVNYLFNGTGPWTVYITDGAGNGVQGSAIANTYCSYN